MSKKAEETAAMRRFILISPLLAPALTEAEASAHRRALLATRTPDGGPLLSARTLRRWLELYRTGGLEALQPRHRRDRGLVKTVTPDVLDAAIALKEELPTRSVRATLRYGLPDKVYVDNGKIFVSDAFKLACARLNVRHAHTAPYAPESKGYGE